MKEYCIGLDIGTSSVGWAMTDTSGQLLSYHKRSTYGATLFEEAEPAKERRTKRSTRRRLDRREQRIDWLQALMEQDVCAVDPDFFHKMNEAFLQQNERVYSSIFSSLPKAVYVDGTVSTGSTGSDAPTIYHIRRLLSSGEKQADIRYVYLAIHHIIKYRGHFLLEGEDMGSLNGETPEEVCERLLELLNDPERLNLGFRAEPAELCEALQQEGCARKRLQEQITSLLQANSVNRKAASALGALLAGLEGSLKDLMGFAGKETSNQKDKDAIKEKLSLAGDKWDEEDYLEAMTEAQAEIFRRILQLYRWRLFSAFTRDGRTLSAEMVERYEQHKRDLKQLKAWVRRYLGPKEYKSLFCEPDAKKNQKTKDEDAENTDQKEKKKGNDGYYAYTGHMHNPSAYKGVSWPHCTQEDFYKRLKSLLNSVKTPEAKAEAEPMLAAMERDNGFLPLQRIKLNGAIPNQLHVQELKLILDGQGKYYPTLRENREKILSLCTFRLPYYVGPLNENSPFQKWLVRRDGSLPVRPWNFEQAVDTIKTAEGFINNLTNKCTYLPTEDVLPLHSLLYEEYLLLDELNRVQVEGKLLCSDLKKRAIEELFAQYKTVTCKRFAEWLNNSGQYQNLEAGDITGTHEAGKFAASLRTRRDLEGIGLRVEEAALPMLEELVRWSTVFEDRSIFRALMDEKYPCLTDKQKELLCRRRYTGWGRLSRTLLDGIQGEYGGEPATVIEVMRRSSENLMRVLHKYQFPQRLEERLGGAADGPITYEEVRELQGSPALKRGVWNAVRIVEELIAHQGCLPRSIYIENTREPGNGQKGKRTSSRVEQLEKIYEGVEAPECKKRLKALGSKQELDDRQFLYFLQQGKCLYSGRPLDFEQLSATTQIDHILPQCYVMDDSLENRALVLSAENQKKSDDLLLKKQVRDEQRRWWNELHARGLMGDRKLRNLLRDHEMTEEEKDRFAARQLVETSQIIQHVIDLFKRHYPQVRVYGMNARLSSALRAQYGLVKLRELNDLHHAYDAFLSCMLGTFMEKHLRWLIDESARQEKIRKRWADASSKDKYGLVVSAFNRDQIDRETGEVLRSAQEEISYLKKVWGYHDGRVVFRKYEGSGEFFDESRYRAGSANAKVPLRKSLPCGRYGGFNGVNPAYIAAISYLQANKRGKKTQKEALVNVPIYLAKKIEQDPSELVRYLEGELGYSEVQVIRPRILLNQKIEYEGNELLLKGIAIDGKLSINNCKQLILSPEDMKTAATILKGTACSDIAERRSELEKQLIEHLLKKLSEQYPRYYAMYENKLPRIRKAVENMEKLTSEEKSMLVRELLNVMGKGREMTPMWGPRDLRVRKLPNMHNIILIDQSITGLRETRKKLWPDSERS